MEEKYTDLAIKLEKTDARSKSNENRINELKDNVDRFSETQITLVKLANGVDKMADQLVDMKTDIKEIKGSQNKLSNKVTYLENKPAIQTKKRLDSTFDRLLWLLLSGFTGVIGFLLARAFPGFF